MMRMLRQEESRLTLSHRPLALDAAALRAQQPLGPGRPGAALVPECDPGIGIGCTAG